MDAPELDLSIDKLMEEGFRRRGGRKKITSFLRYLGGGDCPIEALELTLRRNDRLRAADLRTVSDIVKMVDNKKVNVSECDGGEFARNWQKHEKAIVGDRHAFVV